MRAASVTIPSLPKVNAADIKPPDTKGVFVKLFIAAFSLLLAGVSVHAQSQTPAPQTQIVAEDENALDELNPFDPNIEQQLEEMDRVYEQETGLYAGFLLLEYSPLIFIL